MIDNVEGRGNVLWMNSEGKGQAKMMNRGRHREPVRALNMCALLSAFVCAFILFAALPASTHSTDLHQFTGASTDLPQFTLQIYGNANEDDTVDMRDVTYIKLVIFGKKPETEFCDANYDGRVSMLDVVQTKLIIVGKEAKLTIVDSADRIVTVKKPVERVIVLNHYVAKVIRSLGAKDKIVGIPLTFAVEPYCHFWPDLKNKPVVSGHMAREPDYEAIIKLEPDVVFSFVRHGDPEELAEKLEPAGIGVVLLNCDHMKYFAEETRKLGYILDKKDRAEEFLEFWQSMIDFVEERTKKLKPEEKKTVYYEFLRPYYTFGGGSRIDAVIQKSGGINIFGDIPEYSFEVDPEELLKRDPDVIFKDMHTTPGYSLTDTSKLEEAREEMLSRPGWDKLTAVKNGRVYIGTREVFVWVGGAMGVCHMAKWLHPDLFEDLDPEIFRKEYMEEWQGVPYQGVYTYPELS